MAVMAVVIFHETRGTTLWSDEWGWALYRRGGGISGLLEPHNGHFSLVPLLVYRALFATVGIDDYVPFRVMIIVAHLLCGGLLYVYASRRLGPVAALLPAALLLTLGPAWQNILWPFQVAWLISLAAGLGALLMLDRGDRRGDLWACALLTLSLACSGLGIVIAAGLVVELVRKRRDRRALWILAAPLALYALWWITYQETDFWRHNVVLAPRFAVDAAGGALAALGGLTEEKFDANGTLVDAGAALGWGRPLAAVLAVVVIWRLAALRPVPARVFALLAMAATFWLLTGLQRSHVSSPDTSRYLYVGALLVLLLGVELVRGVKLPRGVAIVIVCAAGLAIVANLGHLRQGARFLRAQGLVARADLGALELARAEIPSGYAAARFPGIPFVVIGAKEYFAAARDFGTPAAGVAEIATTSEQARLAADAELATIYRLALRPGTVNADRVAPEVDVVTGGTTSIRGGCVRFRPAGALPAGTTAELQLTIPPGGLELTAGRGPVTASVRRFARTFPKDALGRLAPEGSAVLRPREDRAAQPWHVQLAPTADVSACGLRAGA